MNLPFSDGADELVGEFLDALPVADYPYLAELAETVVTESYRFADEYSYGLDLVLDSIAVRRR